MSRKAKIAQRRAAVYPLEKLDLETRERVAAQVASDQPPERWIPCGPTRKPLGWIESRGWYEWHWARGIDPQGRREPMPKALRAAVIERDGYICQLCGGQVEPSDVHIDHIKPYSKGGQHVLGNLQVAHSLCNIRKGARV